MTVTRRGSRWKGTEAADLDALLAHYSAAQDEPVGHVAHVACADCGGTTFRLLVDDDEGYAARRCEGCQGEHEMLDSPDASDDADAGEATCPCGGEVFELAVGFAVGEDDEVRWVYVAARCLQDGTLGVYTDWSVDYAPSRHLLTSA